MNIPLLASLLLASSGVSLFSLAAAQASEIPVGVRQVTRTSNATIAIASGYGVNLNFLPIQETIEQVWLDDPSWVTLDADGCLAGLGGTDEDCPDSAATILHLRRIERLPFPGLPRAEQAQLTVVTRSQSGDRQLHVFRLVPDPVASYHTVEIVPEALPRLQAADMRAMRRGRSVAIQAGWLEMGGALDLRVRNFLALLREQPVQSAAEASGISLDLANRLEQLGRASLEDEATSEEQLEQEPPDAEPMINEPSGESNPEPPLEEELAADE